MGVCSLNLVFWSQRFHQRLRWRCQMMIQGTTNGDLGLNLESPITKPPVDAKAQKWSSFFDQIVVAQRKLQAVRTEQDNEYSIAQSSSLRAKNADPRSPAALDLNLAWKIVRTFHHTSVRYRCMVVLRRGLTMTNGNANIWPNSSCFFPNYLGEEDNVSYSKQLRHKSKINLSNLKLNQSCDSVIVFNKSWMSTPTEKSLVPSGFRYPCYNLDETRKLVRTKK